MKDIATALCRWCGYPRRWRVFETEGGPLAAVPIDDFGKILDYPAACVCSPNGRCEAPNSLLERQARRHA